MKLFPLRVPDCMNVNARGSVRGKTINERVQVGPPGPTWRDRRRQSIREWLLGVADCLPLSRLVG